MASPSSNAALAPALAPSPAPAPAPAHPPDGVMARAATLAAQPCPLGRPAPALWAMLTAVSPNARDRSQGLHIFLQNSEHVFGRTVKEASCQFNSPNVSGRHCTISRRYLGPDGRIMPPNHVPSATDRVVACIRDSSSNGTYVNVQRLERNGEEVQLRHGDVVSLVGTPENGTAFSYVYREVTGAAAAAGSPLASMSPGEATGPSNKRKASPPDDGGEMVGGDGKRLKGLGNGGVSGPIMLNDVRQLQRSNEELRVQVEAHVLEVEKMRAEYRTAEARHATEVKEVRAAVAEKFIAQQEELKLSLATKEAEAEASAALRLQLESNIELLQQRLASEAKSRVDAEEVIDGLKLRAEELEKLLEEERSKISKERAEAEASLRAALDRIRLEAAEELKRHEETALRQQEQQNEIILALQEGEREYRAAAEISRKKLDSERAAVVAAEERARRLESQLQEEKVLSSAAQTRADAHEVRLQQTCRELEDEKVAREGAEARIARFEVEMEAACRDLKLEKQRLQGARERIVLRESQLRAFHSTAAEIADLQQRQQDQLSTMIRTLEDGDSDHDNTTVRSTSQPTKVTLLNQGSKETRGTSQSTSGSRLKVQAQNKREDEEKSKGTAIDDDTEGDTQQDGCSNASRSGSDINIPPTQAAPTQMDFCGSLKIASTYDESGFLRHGNSAFVPFTSGDIIGATQLEPGEAGFTQIATFDPGCTQLLNPEDNLEGGSPRRARSSNEGQDGMAAAHRDEEEDEPMDDAHPDNMGIGTVIENTAQWDDGADDHRGTSQSAAAAGMFSRRHHRDSLCTADLMASEVAGSWAMTTPAHGEEDSSSAERAELPLMMTMIPRRTSDEGAEYYAASQVATNNVAGDYRNAAAERNEEKTGTEAGDVDTNIDMSQTTPKHANVDGTGEEAQEQQQQGGATSTGNGMLNLTALSFAPPLVRHHVVVHSDDDSSDTSSTEDGGSREDGEIGASQLRDSEPASPPMMYAQ